VNLLGEGQARDEWASTNITSEPTSPTTTTSFAPRGLSTHNRKVRRKPSRLKLEGPPLKGAVARIHNTCSVCIEVIIRGVMYVNDDHTQSALHSRLGWTENALFLEQFRYTIVASQLLNEHSNPNTYKRQRFPPPIRDRQSGWENKQHLAPSAVGLFTTGATAFVLAWAVRWLKSEAVTHYSRSRITVIALAVVVLIMFFYYYLRHQWLQYLRNQAVESASSLTINAQEFDAAVFAGITLIQEVELVSRGYSMYWTRSILQVEPH